MAKRKPKTLRYRAGKLISATSKSGRKKLKAIKKVVGKKTRPIQRFLKSNSLARLGKRQAKKAVKRAKRLKRSVKSLGRTVKKKRTAARKFLNKVRRDRKQRGILARRQQRETNRKRTQLDLTGTADISGARVRTSNADPGASRPGEPPKMRTGKGRSSIKAQLRLKGKKLESRVYVDKKIAPYMAMWEFRNDGKGRPFLKPAVEDNKEEFGKVVGSELKQANRGGKKKAVVK
jgi:hypothetical protein